MTTLTLSAEESAARSSSKARQSSQAFMAPAVSPPRSDSSIDSASAGATFTSPEVNPRAPDVQQAGAVSSASPASQVNRSRPASRATLANWTGSLMPYLTAITLGHRSPSSRMCRAPIRGSRM